MTQLGNIFRRRKAELSLVSVLALIVGIEAI